MTLRWVLIDGEAPHKVTPGDINLELGGDLRWRLTRGEEARVRQRLDEIRTPENRWRAARCLLYEAGGEPLNPFRVCAPDRLLIEGIPAAVADLNGQPWPGDAQQKVVKT